MKKITPLKKTHIIGIYLAAGNSRRFGSDKLSHPFRGRPLGAYGLNVALQSKLSPLIVITNESQISWLKPFLSNQKCYQLICKNARLGQSESIKCGLREAESRHVDAMMILLADQPFVTIRMINQLIDVYRDKSDTLFVAARHRGIICPPILISQRMFQDLYQLTGDHGAKHLILDKASEGTFVEFDNEYLFYDIDTKDDYNQVLRQEF